MPFPKYGEAAGPRDRPKTKANLHNRKQKMSEAQERRREEAMVEAKQQLDADLAPYHARQRSLNEELTAVQAKIQQIMEGSQYYRLMMKD